jgi:hypothetical protein
LEETQGKQRALSFLLARFLLPDSLGLIRASECDEVQLCSLASKVFAMKLQHTFHQHFFREVSGDRRSWHFWGDTWSILAFQQLKKWRGQILGSSGTEIASLGVVGKS